MSYGKDNDPMSATLNGIGPSEDSDENTHRQSGYQRALYHGTAELFYPLYQRIFRGRDSFTYSTKQDLARANISIPIEIYLSASLGIGTIIGVFTGVLLGLLVYIAIGTGLTLPTTPLSLIPFSNTIVVQILIGLFSALKISIAAFIAGSFGALIGMAGAFFAAVYYPKTVIKKRRRIINLVMPDIVAFMYSLSIGGMDQIEILSAVAESEDTFGEAAVEFQRISKEIHTHNTDYKTAIEDIADKTPSSELSKYLTDMLSVINSGGDMSQFLETQKSYYRDRSRRKQEEYLDTLEILGEAYMSLILFPIIGIIILVIMAVMGTTGVGILAAVVYGLLPLINIIYLIGIAVVKQDSVGDGVLEFDDGDTDVEAEDSITELGVVDRYASQSNSPVFNRIRSRELRYRINGVLRHPLRFFKNNPLYSLAITIPLSIASIAALLIGGIASLSFVKMQSEFLLQTSIWIFLPAAVTLTPLTVFYEWNDRERSKILDSLTGDLRKLANANETGQPLLEALRMTGSDNNTKLGDELGSLYKEVKFGNRLGVSLIAFNNKYRQPRLSRSVKLIQKAQEASSHITDVLQTAAEAAEIQEELAKERVTRTQMQVVIIAVTFFIFLAIMIMLKVFFIQKMLGLLSVSPDFGGFNFGEVNEAYLSLIYLHATAIQAVLAGMISGYVQTGKLHSGLKFVLAYLAVVFIAWWAALTIF